MTATKREPMVALQKHHSIEVADRVVAHLRVAESRKDEVTIYPYANCREQGWAVEVWPTGDFKRKAVASVAECRNSDNIVVYLGHPGEEFDRNTNVPTYRAYRQAMYFNPDDDRGAAAAITSWMSAILASPRGTD